MLRIDAHQHFWDPGQGSYPWMDGPEMAGIRRVFTPEDLQPLAASQGISRSITVQCRHDLEETRDMLGTAADHSLVAGVVGWVDLTAPDVPGQIATLRRARGGEYLVGIRHIIHDESDADWLDQETVRRGLHAVLEADLTFDLLLKPRDMPAAIRCVEAFPEGRFVVDHGAKPRIGSGDSFDTEWSEMIAALAEGPNVWCKISGLVTEADWANWSPEQIHLYIARIVEVFGPRRVMFGSDWPVCTLAASYEAVAELAAFTVTKAGVTPEDFYTRAACAAYAIDEERN